MYGEEVELDEQQRACVTAGTETHMLVTAIPGSGKTRTMAARCQHLLSNGVPPSSIVVLTFTNKAAAEIRGRLQCSLVRCGTFHSIALQCLQATGGLFADEVTLVTDNKAPALFFTKYLRTHAIAQQQHATALARAYAEYRTFTVAPLPAVATLPQSVVLAAFEQYEAYKRRRHEVDFDDLLHEWHHYLEGSHTTDIRHVLVDEAQDCNDVQFDIITQLARLGAKVAAVGDVDQCIYGFRGSNIAHLAHFAETLEGTVKHSLHMNYRSTPEICFVAKSIIDFNTSRTSKNIVSANMPGVVPSLYPFDTVGDEHRFVADVCQKALMNSVECAVLCRSNREVEQIENLLVKKAIPFTLLKGFKLFDSPHVKALVALLTFVFQRDPSTNTVVDVLSMHRGMQRTGSTQLCQAMQTDTVEDSLCLVFLKQSSETWPPSLVTLHRALNGVSNALHHLHADGFKTYVTQLAALCVQHISSMHRLTLEQLRDLELATELLEESDSVDAYVTGIKLGTLQVEGQHNTLVKLGTIHQAKGLEFECVVVTGCVNGNIPSALSRTPAEMEEERRLLYVAATRAKQQLCFTFALHADKQWSGGEKKLRQLSTFLMPLVSYLLVKQNKQLLPEPMLQEHRATKVGDILHDFYRVFGRHNALVTMCNDGAWTPVEAGLPPAPETSMLPAGPVTCLLFKRVMQECALHPEWSWRKCVGAATLYTGDKPGVVRDRMRRFSGEISDGSLPLHTWPTYMQALTEFVDRLLASRPETLAVHEEHSTESGVTCTVDLLVNHSLFTFLYDRRPSELLAVHAHTVAACLRPRVTTLILVNFFTGEVLRKPCTPLPLTTLPLIMQAHALVQHLSPVPLPSVLPSSSAPCEVAKPAPH